MRNYCSLIQIQNVFKLVLISLEIYHIFNAMVYNYRCDKILSYNEELYPWVDFNVLFWDQWSPIQQRRKKIPWEIFRSFYAIFYQTFTVEKLKHLCCYFVLIQDDLVKRAECSNRKKSLPHFLCCPCFQVPVTRFLFTKIYTKHKWNFVQFSTILHDNP